MTTSTTAVHCPVCGSENTKTINQASRRCLECNVVFTAEDGPVDVGKPSPTNTDSDSGKEDHQQWQDVVTVRDSSDETIVRLIEDTEGYIQELHGRTDDCIVAAEIIAEAWENQYFRGRSILSGIAAVVYTTFREQGTPRPLGIVANTCDVSVQEIRTAYQSLKSTCNRDTTITPSTAYLSFLRAQLGLSDIVEGQARQLIESSEISGSPAGIASAGLYLATKDRDEAITLAESGAASGVAKETVWRKTQELSS